MATCTCRGALITVNCPSDCAEVVEYTFENINLTGVGVFSGLSGTTVSFKGVASANSMLTVTNDAGNGVVLLTPVIAAIAAAFPAATETVAGIQEIATQAETNAGSADDKLLTPLKLATCAASETQKGVLEIATQAEVTTGTDDTRAVSPLKLATANAGQKVTKTFLSGAMASTAPAFVGQFGATTDTFQTYVGYQTSNGAWNAIISNGAVAAFDTVSVLSLTGGNFVVNGNTTYGLTIQDGGLDFETGSEIRLGGSSLAAESLLGVDASQDPAQFLISNFISTENTQTGWGAIGGAIARSGWGTFPGISISNPPTQAEVTSLNDALATVSQRFGALLTDLLAVKLPAS